MEEQLLNIDLSGYDLTNLSDAEVKDLIHAVNLEVGRILQDSQAQFYSAYRDEADKAYSKLDSLEQEIFF